MILLYNGKIWGYSDEVNTVVIKEDKIFYIGEFNNIPNGEYKKKINLKNKLLLPSFIDTHTHFSEYIKLKSQINFSKVINTEQMLKLINENPEKVKGYGLNISKFNKNELNSFFKNLTRKPLLTIASSDYHSYLTTAIGLTDWPPKLLNNKEKINNKDIKFAIIELYKMGITSIHEMAFTKKDFYLYDDFYNNLEVCRHFPLEMLDDIIKTNQKSYLGNEYLKLGSLKLFYDGSIGSSTASMFNSNTGKLSLKYNGLDKIIKKALNNDISISIHAIGDRGVDDIVNLFVKYKNSIKNFVRIEHAQTITDETIKKLESIKDKVYLSMQPLHIRDDYTSLKDMDIKNTSFRFKSLKNITIGFSSDLPVVEFNPFKAIYYAITHKLNKNEAIKVEEAIDNYTINAAKLSNSDKFKGSIEIGKFANLVLINDYRKYEENFWLNAKSYLTILRAKVVYSDL